MPFLSLPAPFPSPKIDLKLSDGQLIALAVATPVLAAAYLAFRLPDPPKRPVIHPGLASLPGPDTVARNRLRDLYPEDTYPDPQYAPLPLGKIKYHLLGSEHAPKLVLICGISIPSTIWSKVISVLKEHFYVLVFDHYGRGYSEAPEARYDAMFYSTQLALLMQYVGWNKAKIAGVSMGGGIAVNFAQAYPYLVDGQVALIAPVGLLSNGDLPLAGRLLTTPLVQFFIGGSWMRSIGSWLYKTENYDNPVAELFKLQQLVLPYNMAALSSSVRDGPLRRCEEAYSALGASDFEVVMIWGTFDEDVPYRLSTEALKRMPKAKLVTIDGAGHDITVSHPQIVSQALLDFFG